jgi:hypothetical protein
MGTRVRIALAAVATAALLVACYGNTGYTPQAQYLTGRQPVPEPASLSSLPAPVRSALARVPNVSSLCPAPVAKIPGTYTVYVSAGKVSGSKFAGDPKASLWYAFALKKSSSPPPSPVPSVSPTPSSVAYYVYYGTFTLVKGKGGCAFLIATADGKPLPKSTYNGISAGLPHIVAKDYSAVISGYGPATVSIAGLSAAGGKGTLALKTTTGGTVTTGSIDLLGRVLIK